MWGTPHWIPLKFLFDEKRTKIDTSIRHCLELNASYFLNKKAMCGFLMGIDLHFIFVGNTIIYIHSSLIYDIANDLKYMHTLLNGLLRNQKIIRQNNWLLYVLYKKWIYVSINTILFFVGKKKRYKEKYSL